MCISPYVNQLNEKQVNRGWFFGPGSRKPKGKSKGFGDTIAKITHATGLNKVAEAVAKAAGKDDCGCGRRQDKLNEMFPYLKETKQESKTKDCTSKWG